MATLKQKIEAEQKARALLEDYGLPQPDEVDYGYTCVRLLWHEQKAMMIVQIDEPPPGFVFAEDLSEEQRAEILSQEPNPGPESEMTD